MAGERGGPMPTFTHEPWCDPRTAHTISVDVHSVDFTCQSEAHRTGHAWAQLEQSPKDPEPILRLHLGSDESSGPYDVDLSIDAARVLVQFMRNRPDELEELLEGLVELSRRGVKHAS
jgi:hypothetical protein